MPNTRSAIRKVRKIKKQTSINKSRKGKIKSAIKKMENLIKNGKKDEAKKFFPKFQSILMQVAKTGSINKRTIARKISRLSKKIN